MTTLLLPLSWLYGLVVRVRNILFDAGVLRVRRSVVPVIAVGNLTAGGTGKTPLVEFLVSLLIQRGRRVAIVSRGYGRTSRGVVVVSRWGNVGVTADEGGDEPVQLALRHRDVSVVVGERRVDAAALAVQELGADVVVLDDAFQHRYLWRDLNILILDARRDIFHEPMLPAGRRREPLTGIARADLVVLSRVPEGEGVVPWSAGVRRRTTAPVCRCRIMAGEIRRAKDDGEVSREHLRGRRVVAFSGVADNTVFAGDVHRLGCNVTAVRGFPDHHRYSRADAIGIMEAFRTTRAEFLVTTEKDVARLRHGEAGRMLTEAPLVYLRVRVVWIDGAGELEKAVVRVIGRGDGK